MELSHAATFDFATGSAWHELEPRRSGCERSPTLRHDHDVALSPSNIVLVDHLVLEGRAGGRGHERLNIRRSRLEVSRQPTTRRGEVAVGGRSNVGHRHLHGVHERRRIRDARALIMTHQAPTPQRQSQCQWYYYSMIPLIMTAMTDPLALGSPPRRRGKLSSIELTAKCLL
jgi:hypothetical protein